MFLDHEFANTLLLHARVMAKAEIQKSTALTNASEEPSTSGVKNMNVPPTDSEESTVVDDIPSIVENSKITNVWNYNQTVCLIKSMATFYRDFNDPRKRKHIFENVANDLISHGFAVDSKSVQNKWKGLLRSYTKAKDTKNRTGQGPSRFLFYEMLDDIVGNQPKNSCTHSLNVLETSENIDKENVETMTSEIEDVRHPEETLKTSTEAEKPEEEHTNSTRKKRKFSAKQYEKEYIELKRGEHKRRQ